MLSSLLIASVSAGPTSTTSIGPSPIKNHCVDGVVPHSYMVTLKSPLPPDRRSAPTSAGLNTNKGDLSFLHGWFRQYTTKNTSNGTTRRKLEAGSNSAHAVHYFMQTRLAVAIEAGDDVRHAQHAPKSSTWPSASRLYSRSHTPHQVAMSMAKDPAVSSVEFDCYRQVDTSLPKSGDSSPDLYEVGRRLSVQVDAPWGIDRIDTDGEPTVMS